MAVKKHKNSFYLVKSLFQSFNLWFHPAEAQTAACTLTRWCYQLITHPLPRILWHKQTALQINQRRTCTVGIFCSLGLSCSQWCHNQIMKMSISELLSLPVDCPLAQSAHAGKCFNRDFLHIKLTLCIFWTLQPIQNIKCETWWGKSSSPP